MTTQLVVHAQQMLRVSALNPQAYNPRRISPEKYEALKQNIRDEGFVEPIVVQKKGLGIIGGHQRYRAWKELAIEASIAPPDLPCTVLDIDDARAKKLNIKLNSLTGEFEPRLLGELLHDLFENEVTADDSEALGFTVPEVHQYIRIVDPDYGPPPVSQEQEEPKSFGKSITLSLEFGSIAARDRVKKILAEQAKVEKKRTGEIVDALLSPKRKPVKKTAAKKSRAA